MNASRSLASELESQSVDVRIEIVHALHQAGGGHFGGAMSVVDILLALYRSVPLLPREARDRIILSKGHAAIAQYAVLKNIGLLAGCDLGKYGGLNSGLEGHPDMNETEGIDFSTGSLGQGVAVGLGMAMALRPSGLHVWVIVGDGECQEGQVWEAAGLAARYRVSNLHVIVDLNGAQEMGWTLQPYLTQEPLPLASEKWRAFEWEVTEVDGHSFDNLIDCFARMRTGVRPSVLIARTAKGKGVRMFEEDPTRFHCTVLTQQQHANIMEELYAKKAG